MQSFPITYHEPLFRPPAEAHSLIVQATIGCSWNRCAFCEMYTSKSFRARRLDYIATDIDALALLYQGVRKVFIADGNAFVLSASRLVPILEALNNRLGRLQRVSAYALPSDILSKTEDELKTLHGLGLKLLYIGIETGNDELLGFLNKGETYQSTYQGITKAHRAGIATSVMIITGVGGKTYSQQHALCSARLVNELNPKYLSTLTLTLPYGTNHFRERFGGEYIPQTHRELLMETQTFIENLHLSNVIFRSDHASNNLVLKGVLGRDKDLLLAAIKSAL